MAEKRYKVIGKTPQMRTVMLYDEKGNLRQKCIQRGIEYEVSESEMNFHIRRQEARKILKVIEIETEEENTEEAPVEEKPKTRRRRRRK